MLDILFAAAGFSVGYLVAIFQQIRVENSYQPPREPEEDPTIPWETIREIADNSSQYVTDIIMIPMFKDDWDIIITALEEYIHRHFIEDEEVLELLDDLKETVAHNMRRNDEQK